MAKIYAVKRGRNPGIYTTWAECQRQTSGFCGAVFKSFPTEDEARRWMDNMPPEREGSRLTKEIAEALESGAYVAFTDGCFIPHRQVWGWGVVLLRPEGAPEEMRGFGRDYLKSRNVAAEIFAATQAVRRAADENAPRLVLYHDYQGVGAWADGLWDCNMELTQNYAAEISLMRRQMEIIFRHVHGHSGVEWNERADRLAAQGAAEAK